MGLRLVVTVLRKKVSKKGGGVFGKKEISISKPVLKVDVKRESLSGLRSTNSRSILSSPSSCYSLPTFRSSPTISPLEKLSRSGALQPPARNRIERGNLRCAGLDAEIEKWLVVDGLGDGEDDLGGAREAREETWQGGIIALASALHRHEPRHGGNLPSPSRPTTATLFTRRQHHLAELFSSFRDMALMHHVENRSMVAGLLKEPKLLAQSR